MPENTNTESNTETVEVEDKDSRKAKVVNVTTDMAKATVHGLHVAGVKVIDTDMRDMGKATKRLFKGLSKDARQARILAKAEAIKAEKKA